MDWDTYAATNSVLFISPQGELVKSYAKIHPVPFAEAIPLWEYEWFRKFMREVIGLESGWVMGSDVAAILASAEVAGIRKPERGLQYPDML